MIETGMLKRLAPASGENEIAFEMRFLEKRDLPQIMALQDIILHRLSRKDLLEAFSDAFMASHIGARGFIIGIFVYGDLVAFRNVYFPEVNDREWNLGYDIGLEAPVDLEKVVNLQMICVHPNFRGYSLGLRLNAHAIETIQRLGRHTHLCATVSPYNYWNIRILLAGGLVIRALKEKYNGKLRYIVHRNLTRPFDVFQSNDRVTVRLTDIEPQKELLRRGYVGVEFRETAGFLAQRPSDFANGFELVFSAA